MASQTHLQETLKTADSLMQVDAATTLTSRHCNDFDVFCLMLLINYKLVMCKFTIANCGKHTALHGKPNTFTETLGHCRCVEVGWCCNSAHKQALQWFWCFCLMLLSKSCACMLQHTIEADCGQHIALHGKPNTFKENSGNCRFADVSWCCNNAHKQALQWFWCFLPDALN